MLKNKESIIKAIKEHKKLSYNGKEKLLDFFSGEHSEFFLKIIDIAFMNGRLGCLVSLISTLKKEYAAEEVTSYGHICHILSALKAFEESQLEEAIQ